MTQAKFETLDIPEFLTSAPLPTPLDIPAEMVVAIATGFEEPKEIAARYGFEGARWKQLSEWKPFLDAVAQQKAEFETNGNTFRLKAKVLTEDVFEDAYKIARSNDSTLMQKLEFVKLGAKLADMEPKASANVQSAGAGFSITINMGTHKDVSKKADIVDISPKQIENDDE